MLYVVFFAVIAFSVVMMFTSPANREAFYTGMSDADRMFDNKESGMRTQIMYDIDGYPEGMNFPLTLYIGNDATIYGRPSRMDLEIVSPSKLEAGGLGWSMFFLVLSALMYISVFVIIFIILTSLRRSVRQGNLMERRVVPLTRSIGILLIGASLLMSLSVYLERKALIPYFIASGFSISTAMSFDFVQIITGILIFVIAEIFSIGYGLSEEQKLTI